MNCVFKRSHNPVKKDMRIYRNIIKKIRFNLLTQTTLRHICEYLSNAVKKSIKNLFDVDEPFDVQICL